MRLKIAYAGMIILIFGISFVQIQSGSKTFSKSIPSPAWQVGDYYKLRQFSLNYTNPSEYYFIDYRYTIENEDTWLGTDVFNVSTTMENTNGSISLTNYSSYYNKNTFEYIGHNRSLRGSNPQSDYTFDYWAMTDWDQTFQLGSGNWTFSINQTFYYQWDSPQNLPQSTIRNQNTSGFSLYHYIITEEIVTVAGETFDTWKVNSQFIKSEYNTTRIALDNTVDEFYSQFIYYLNGSGFQVLSYSNNTATTTINYYYYNSSNPFLDTYWLTKDLNMTVKSEYYGMVGTTQSNGNIHNINGIWYKTYTTELTEIQNGYLTATTETTSTGSSSSTSSTSTSLVTSTSSLPSTSSTSSTSSSQTSSVVSSSETSQSTTSSSSSTVATTSSDGSSSESSGSGTSLTLREESSTEGDPAVNDFVDSVNFNFFSIGLPLSIVILIYYRKRQ